MAAKEVILVKAPLVGPSATEAELRPDSARTRPGPDLASTGPG
jgi:hypothetical protein